MEVRDLSPAKAKKAAASKPKRPKCHTCGKRIHIPAGWSNLPAIRRHYWAHHRDVMQANLGGSGSKGKE
jgi:hypothetical protein